VVLLALPFRYRYKIDYDRAATTGWSLDALGSTHYEFVDLWSYLVQTRLDQDLMFAEGPGWTGLNRIQLQPNPVCNPCSRT